jgi:hypothetical protein
LPHGGHSHYYAARETDAVPLKVGSQSEKFLFYRGVSSFDVPVTALPQSNGRILVSNRAESTIPQAILYERRGTRLGYRLLGPIQHSSIVDAPELNSDLATLSRDLEKILIEDGLYPDEARAMLKTWNDSWFEEGTRLFYLVSPRTLDSILPLAIDPRPSEIARVFVGRMELVTPTTEHEVEEALTRNDLVSLGKYARFLPAIADRVLAKASPVDRARMQTRLQSVSGSFRVAQAACNR